MYRLSRYLLVGFLTFGMVVDSASAARWLNSICCSYSGPAVYVEYGPSFDVCCHPQVVCCETAPVCLPRVTASEDSTAVEGNYYQAPEYQAPEPTPPEPSTQAAQEPIAPPEESTEEASGEAVPQENSVVKKPAVEPAAPAPSPVPVAVPEDRTASESRAPSEPKSEPEPESMEESPLDTPPASNVSEPPPEEKASEVAPVPDVFDEPTTVDDRSVEEKTPAESSQEPSHAEETDLQDLFGSTSEEESPAEGGPSPIDSTEKDNAIEEADSLEDLFGPTDDEAPSTETVPSAVVEPVEEADPLEDLFGPTSEEEPTETDGNGSMDDPSSDDLFGHEQAQPVLRQPGGLASQATRSWVDNTARYRCEARLLRVASEKVLLAKIDGQRVVVPFSRLSDADLNFVQQQVVAKRQLLAKRTAVEKLASLWSD